MGIELILIISLAGVILVSITRNKFLLTTIVISSSFISFIIAFFYYLKLNREEAGFQFISSYTWIPAWQLNFVLGLDHINAPFILLTSFITVVAVLLSLRTIQERLNTYMAFLLLLSLTVNAFFMSTNFLQFFFFYEAMLIPTVLLIQRWGGQNAYLAALRFLLYTFGFSIFLFISIIVVYIYAGGFGFESLFDLKLSNQAKLLLLLSFLLAFFVKIPIVPLHGWLREAYYEAPMPVTIFLSAVLGKMGIYGILRVIPYFSDLLPIVGEWLMGLSLISFLFAAFLALNAKDLKILFTYASLSHVGIITAGVFTGNINGYQGALLQSINHGILVAGLFYIVELLSRDTGSFESQRFGALTKRVPVITFSAFTLIMAMGGFPGLNYFNGEFLILSGILKENVAFGFFGLFGVALGVVYLSWFFYKVFLKKPAGEISQYIKDVSSWEFLLLMVFLFLSIYLGLSPDFILSGISEIVVFGGKG